MNSLSQQDWQSLTDITRLTYLSGFFLIDVFLLSDDEGLSEVLDDIEKAKSYIQENY